MGISTEREACTERSLSHRTVVLIIRFQQQGPVVHRSNTLLVMKTVEANQSHGTTRTSLPLLQPAQCPLEMWEIFMLYPVVETMLLPCIPIRDKTETAV
jgi:hypothetical protein